MTSPNQRNADKKIREAILSSFNPDFFVNHPSWQRLSSLLENEGGGSYGLAGPRGAGKTWMMLKANAWIEQEGGLGVWFPSPSDYESSAFLAQLSWELATSYEEWHDKLSQRTSRLVLRRFYTHIMVGTTLLYVGAGIWFLIYTSGYRYGFPPVLAESLLPYAFVILPIAIGLWFILRGFKYRRDSKDGLGQVRVRAEELRRQVRFVINTKETSEVGAEAGHWGLLARFKQASERQLIERPATLSSLIHDFRDFAERAGQATNKLVVCIDELDKMSDAAKVAELLRDIKGIFEIPNVVFLVSISDEAARSLELGSIRARNEFSSSFYTVIRVDNFSTDTARTMLTRRAKNLSADVAQAATILSGGLAREIVRNADLAIECNGSDITKAALAMAAEEINAFKLDLLETPSSNGPSDGYCLEHDKLTVQQILPIENHIPPYMDPNFSLFIMRGLRHWTLPNASSQWRADFEEQWRRLLIRLAVAGIMAQKTSQLANADTQTLQNIVVAASQSALAARAQFFEYALRPLGLRIPADLPEPQLYLLAEAITEPGSIIRARASVPGLIETRHVFVQHANALVRLGAFQKCGHQFSRSWRLATQES